MSLFNLKKLGKSGTVTEMLNRRKVMMRNILCTDGRSANFLFTRPVVPKDNEDIKLEMNDLEAWEMQDVLRLWGADPGATDIFVASDGNGNDAHEIRSISTAEYYVKAGYKKNQATMKSLKQERTSKLSTFEQHLQYYFTHLDTLLQFYDGRFTDLRFSNYRGQQKMDNELVNIVCLGGKLMEMEVKSFMAIIKQMPLTSATKSEFLVAQDAYQAFVSTKGMCVKGGVQTMIKYLHHAKCSMMVNKQFWVGYYVNNLMHMGNRTSNTVESTHANIKRSNNTSSGRMAVATEKIDLWIKKREDYRNLQSIKECVSQRPVFVEHDIADQLSLIRLNVSSFAFESIKNKLIQIKASEENPNHVSHVRSGENCLLPLSVVYQRWRISYVKGNVATVAEVSTELGKDSSPKLCSNTNEVQFRLEKLLSLCKVLGSQQESVDLLKDMDALIVKYSTDRLDTALTPEIVEIKKGSPKGTKRSKLGVEHEDEKICLKQKNSKKVKLEQKKVENNKSQKKTNQVFVSHQQQLYKPSEVVTRNSDNSILFKMLDSQYADDVLGFVNPTPGGNCGFRAVSAAVFGHEEAWIQVKRMMLATFSKYASSIYDSYGLNESYIRTKLLSTKAPCLDNLHLWFDCYGCPQIVADTLNDQ
ncbi:hypothetical protein INT47_002765 [Mucor saturninus]|uniref:OTU domain-containing protein n=1 Tax=Mucor saturninus TaxID=64648 RepID=A0A8H7QI82_9FUNG|nr:hypothetical protein INT47_002765 [Mucor saturninus]